MKTSPFQISKMIMSFGTVITLSRCAVNDTVSINNLETESNAQRYKELCLPRVYG